MNFSLKTLSCNYFCQQRRHSRRSCGSSFGCGVEGCEGGENLPFQRRRVVCSAIEIQIKFYTSPLHLPGQALNCISVHTHSHNFSEASQHFLSTCHHAPADAKFVGNYSILSSFQLMNFFPTLFVCAHSAAFTSLIFHHSPLVKFRKFKCWLFYLFNIIFRSDFVQRELSRPLDSEENFLICINFLFHRVMFFRRTRRIEFGKSSNICVLQIICGENPSHS